MKRYLLILLLVGCLALPSHAGMVIQETASAGCTPGSEMIKPNSTTQGQFSTGGSPNSSCTGNCDYVDDCSDYTCSSPTTSDYINSNWGAATDIYGLSNSSSQCDDASQIVCKAYLFDDGSNTCSDEIELKINIDSQLEVSSEGAQDIANAWGWYTWTFSGGGKTWSSSDVDAATLQIIAAACGDSSDVLGGEIVCQTTW